MTCIRSLFRVIFHSLSVNEEWHLNLLILQIIRHNEHVMSWFNIYTCFSKSACKVLRCLFYNLFRLWLRWDLKIVHVKISRIYLISPRAQNDFQSFGSRVHAASSIPNPPRTIECSRFLYALFTAFSFVAPHFYRYTLRRPVSSCTIL